MENELIFTVNPGATTTKCALYAVKNDVVHEYASEGIEHPDNVINGFESISQQVDYREKSVRAFIDRSAEKGDRIIACAGRGGMLTPVPSGVIEVNDELVDFSLFTPVYQHASNLGAPLAYRIAKTHSVKAYIADPVGVDEFTEIARISGSPQFPRFSFVHALNIRATARKFGEDIDMEFDSMKCVVAHLGAGFSIAALDKGRIVDNDNRMEGASFTPERAGGVPPIPLVNACFSGKYSKKEIMKMLYGEAGLYAYLNTKDVREVLSRIARGDKEAELAYSAMIYQICKEIAAMASVLKFEMHGILLTGGLAFSEKIVSDIKDRIGKIGEVYVYPGSNENRSLAESVVRVMNGLERCMQWPVNKGECQCQ